MDHKESPLALCDPSNTISYFTFLTITDHAVQLRNMRNALTLIKGKRRKMSNPDMRLAIGSGNEDSSFFVVRGPSPPSANTSVSPPTAFPGPSGLFLQKKELDDLKILYPKRR
jgi:hypothetical protein